MAETQGAAAPAAPVTVNPQGATAPAAPVTAPGNEPTTPKVETTQVPQSEWQATQEKQRKLEKEIARINLEKFESENPIVKNDKYKDDWKKLQKQKEDPESPYHRLSHDDLLKIMYRPDPVTPPPPPTVPVPSLNSSVAPDAPLGKADTQSRQWLSMAGFSEEEIAATETAK